MAKQSNSNKYQDRDIADMKKDIKEITRHIAVLNEEGGSLRTDVRWLKLEFIKMRTALEEIKDKVNKRPSWLTATVFSVLFSALIGLIVYLVTQ